MMDSARWKSSKIVCPVLATLLPTTRSCVVSFPVFSREKAICPFGARLGAEDDGGRSVGS